MHGWWYCVGQGIVFLLVVVGALGMLYAVMWGFDWVVRKRGWRAGRAGLIGLMVVVSVVAVWLAAWMCHAMR